MKNRDIARASLVLEQDRLGISNNVKELLKIEIAQTLAEFFNLKGEVEINIEKENDDFLLLIKVKGNSFKGFYTLN